MAGAGTIAAYRQAPGAAFNGCYALTYSAQDHLNDSYSSAILNWGRRYVRENIDDLRCFCGDGTAMARSKSGGLVEVYLGFFYSKTSPGRAETLIHESRHQGGKPHDANFPAGSTFGSGKSGADSSWDYEGAWMYGALYVWWYYAAADPHHLSPARTGSTAGQPRNRQRVRDPPGILDLTDPV
jgi:hypothetical protein